MVAAAYAVVRAVEHAGTRWLLLAGALVGLGVPHQDRAGAARAARARGRLPVGGADRAVATGRGSCSPRGSRWWSSGGWWFAAVALWPAADRPYIGGSTTTAPSSSPSATTGWAGSSARAASAAVAAAATDAAGTAGVPDGAAGSGTAGVPGGGAADAAGGFPVGPGGFGGGRGGPFGGNAGLGRLFANDVGGQIAWLLPAALALLVIGMVLTRRAPRTDRLRASLIVWGGWTVVTALVFSLMEGIFHQYYTVALAPGVAALVGIGGALLWRRRSAAGARWTLAALVVGTAAWAWVLLGRTPEFVPWLRWVIVAVGVVGAALLLLPGRGRVVAAAALVAAVGVGPPRTGRLRGGHRGHREQGLDPARGPGDRAWVRPRRRPRRPAGPRPRRRNDGGSGRQRRSRQRGRRHGW